MKVLIAGGGIGGLSAALCLLHNGIDVTVLERAPELGEVGAGIQIPPNAMKIFRALGIDSALSEAGFKPEALEARMGHSGRQLFRLPLSENALARWGAPYLHIHRADYISVLETALRVKSPNALRLGAEVDDVEQTGSGVKAILVDGTIVDGDVLIGADGIHSTIRSLMLGPQSPVFTGNVAWRAVVPIEALGENAPRPTACVWMGAGRHCVTYQLRGGTLANFVGVVERDDWQIESWTERGTKEDALRDFAGWHPTITDLLQNTDDLFRWALFDRPPLERWVNGRVALLGDAAHPMLPFMAQGAAMAIEDGWVLAGELARSVSTERALTRYQSIRIGRASRVQAGSRANAKTFHKSGRLGQLMTYGPMWLAGHIAPSLIYRRQDSLYAYDVTAINKT